MGSHSPTKVASVTTLRDEYVTTLRPHFKREMWRGISFRAGNSSLLLELAGQGFESESTQSTGGGHSTKPETPSLIGVPAGPPLPRLKLALDAPGDAATEDAEPPYETLLLDDDVYSEDMEDVATVEEAAALLLRLSTTGVEPYREGGASSEGGPPSPKELSEPARQDARSCSEPGGAGDSASERSRSPGEAYSMEEATPPGSAVKGLAAVGDGGGDGDGDDEHDTVLLEESLQGGVGIAPQRDHVTERAPMPNSEEALPHDASRSSDASGLDQV